MKVKRNWKQIVVTGLSYHYKKSAALAALLSRFRYQPTLKRYCIACIVSFWESGNLSTRINCPICRRLVSIMIIDNHLEVKYAESRAVSEFMPKCIS